MAVLIAFHQMSTTTDPSLLYTVAYLGFYFGGVQNFFWKSGGTCVAKPRVFMGGSGACSPEKIFKNGAF